MKNILCFGDSNTWGYDADADDRFPYEKRWPGRLQSMGSDEPRIYEAGIPDLTFCWDCEGLPVRNGTKVCNAFITAAMPLYLIVIVAGTNDCKSEFSTTAEQVGKNATTLIRKMKSQEWCEAYGTRILIVSPVPMTEAAADVEGMDNMGALLSHTIAEPIRKAAESTGAFFADASEWGVELCADGIHYTTKGHETFAKEIYSVIKDIAQI